MARPTGCGHRTATSTPKLILATNGFTDGWGFLERHLIRLVTYASITKPLTDKQLAVMAATRTGRHLYHPHGLDGPAQHDNRLMMRNCFRYGGDTGMGTRRRAGARTPQHIDALKARFPQLASHTSSIPGAVSSACRATLPPLGRAGAGCAGLGLLQWRRRAQGHLRRPRHHTPSATHRTSSAISARFPGRQP
jgi:hypothetical protein